MPRGHRRIRTFGTYSVRLFSRQVHSTALPYVHFNSRIHIGCDSIFDIYAKFDITRRRMASFLLIIHYLVLYSTSGGTRTHTAPLLRRSSLPIGIQRPVCNIHHSIYTATFVNSACCGDVTTVCAMMDEESNKCSICDVLKGIIII